MKTETFEIDELPAMAHNEAMALTTQPHWCQFTAYRAEDNVIYCKKTHKEWDDRDKIEALAQMFKLTALEFGVPEDEIRMREGEIRACIEKNVRPTRREMTRIKLPLHVADADGPVLMTLPDGQRLNTFIPPVHGVPSDAEAQTLID